jgi:hypothetical protein
MSRRHFQLGDGRRRLARLAATAKQANSFASIANELLAQKRREGKAYFPDGAR